MPHHIFIVEVQSDIGEGSHVLHTIAALLGQGYIAFGENGQAVPFGAQGVRYGRVGAAWENLADVVDVHVQAGEDLFGNPLCTVGAKTRAKSA